MRYLDSARRGSGCLGGAWDTAVVEENDSYAKAETAGRSLDQARILFEDTYNGDSFGAEHSERDFAFRYTSTGNADMTLRSSTFTGALNGSLRPEDEYIVAWITDGHGAYDIAGDELELRRGRPVVFPHGKRFSFDMVDYRQNLVHFRAEFLEQVAAEHEGALPGPLQFDPAHVPTEAELRRWQQVIGTAAKTVLGSEPPPLLQAEVNRLTAVTFLDTFAHQTLTLDPVLLAPRNARLREAVEFIHAHAREPISITDVARACHLSTRGLQAAFQNQLSTTPLEYLRGVRLEHVRAELLAAHPDDATVGDIAKRWGFLHLGRFAGSYAEKYGERPSDTLRR